MYSKWNVGLSTEMVLTFQMLNPCSLFRYSRINMLLTDIWNYLCYWHYSIFKEWDLVENLQGVLEYQTRYYLFLFSKLPNHSLSEENNVDSNVLYIALEFSFPPLWRRFPSFSFLLISWVVIPNLTDMMLQKKCERDRDHVQLKSSGVEFGFPKFSLIQVILLFNLFVGYFLFTNAFHFEILG